MLQILFPLISAIGYGAAPIIYRPALKDNNLFKIQALFSLLTIPTAFIMPWRNITHNGVIYAGISSILGNIIGGVLLLKTIKIGGAAMGSLISSMYVITSQILLFELKILPYAVIVALGIILLSSEHNKNIRRGIIYGIITALSWGLSVLSFNNAIREMGPGPATLMRSTIVVTIISIATYKYKLRNLRTLIVGGFMESILGYTFFAYSFYILGGGLTVLISSIYPLITVALDKEFRGMRKITGALTVLIGIIGAIVNQYREMLI